MKKTIKLFSVVLLIALTVVSCNKEEDITLASGQCSVTAKFSGNISGTYKSNDLTSKVQKVYGTYMLISTALTSSMSAQNFTITLPENIKEGTYNISAKTVSETGVFVFVYDSTNQSSGYVAGADEDTNFNFTITKNDGAIVQGTFKGDMFNVDHKKITVDGTFKAAL